MKKKVVTATLYSVTDEAAKFLCAEAARRGHLVSPRDCIAQLSAEDGGLLGVMQMHGRYKVSAKQQKRGKFLLTFQRSTEQWEV